MLNLSEKFNNDIQYKETNITPLLVIDNDIYISTVKGSLNSDIFLEDYNLNVTSTTDSIDIKNKTIQINKVSFTISNYEINGKRFSDFIFERGLLNKEAELYYKTQTCTSLEDCLLIFKGAIRKLNHDSKTVKIDLEDFTEDVLKKNVPISNTGYTNNVYNKDYVNKPIPIVYGKVDKSPAIPYIDKENPEDEVSVRIVCDAVNVVDPDRNIQLQGVSSIESEYISSLEQGNNPLYIYKDSYYQVLQDYNSDVITGGADYDTEDWSWGDEEQYTINNDIIEIRKKHQGVIPQNPPAFNEFQCVKVRFPNQCMLMTNDFGEEETDNYGFSYENINVDILNPEFAVDNPFQVLSSSNINPTIFNPDSYFDTRAQIPNNLITEDNEYLYDGFRLHQYNANNKGMFFPSISSVTWGHRIYEWLYLYSDIINNQGYDDPSIVFKQFPTAQGIKNRLREVVNNQILNSENVPIGFNYDTQPWSGSKGIQPHFVYDDSNYEGLNAFSTDGTWFDEQFSATGEKINCPQPFFYFRGIKNNYKDVFGADYVCVTMDNNTINMFDALPNSGTTKVYNLFNLGDGHPYLFNSEDFEEFVPYQLTNSFNSGRQFFRSFGVKKTEFNTFGHNQQYFHTGSDFNSGGAWFGSYGMYYAGWNHMRTRETDMFDNPQQSWVLWAKKNIENVGDTLAYLTEFNAQLDNPFDAIPEAKNKIRITKNTIFPNTHRAHNSYVEGGYDTIAFGSYGSLRPSGNYFQIQAEDTIDSLPDRRLSLMFPLGDLDISDEIHTDTFFHGKIKCFISDDTISAPSTRFVLSVAPIDVVDFDLSEIIDDDAVKLIDKTTQQVDGTEQWWSSDPQDYPSEDTDLNSENDNYTSTDGLARLNYFDPSTFTTLNLTYRVNTLLASGADYPVRLSTDIYSVGLVHYIIFEKALDSPFYVDVFGRTREGQDGEISLIENPSVIITDFLEKELDYTNLDLEGLNLSLEAHELNAYAFTINEIKKGKEFIEDLSKDTKLLPKFRSNSEFTCSYIKNTYGDEDVNITINTDDILKYNFTRTPLEDIHTIVNVKYKKDYAEDEYMRETGYVDGYDMFGNGDGIEEAEGREDGYSYQYLGLERENKVLEYESDHIRDKYTATSLRNFLYMYNCNQHNIFNLELPIKYINLEAGDVIKFDKLIEDIKAYGEDYTQPVKRNGQNIYPYFIITKITRKLKGVSLKCVQLHDLMPTFDCKVGSITRMIDSSQQEFVYLEDYNLFEKYFIQTSEKYFTTVQKNAADINKDGIITMEDLSDLHTLYLFYESVLNGQFLGDANLDGEVNVQDLVELISTITSGDVSEFELLVQDVNQDGIINVIDVINIVNQIVEGSIRNYIPGNNYTDDVGFDEFGFYSGVQTGDEDEQGGGL